MGTHRSAAKRGLDAMLEKLICDDCKGHRSRNLQCSCLRTLCEDCARKSKKCKFCGGDAPTKPNDLMNYTIKMYTKLCDNSADGCTVTGNDFYLKEHLAVCEYRPVTCPLKDKCGKISIAELWDHMKRHHKAELLTVKEKDGAKVVIEVKRGVGPKEFVPGIPFIMRYNNRTFMGYTVQSNEFLTFHSIMLGPKSAADNYDWSIVINPDRLPRKGFGDTTSSAADHCVSPKKQLAEKVYDFAIPFKFLKKYASEVTDKKIKITLRFAFQRNN